MAQTSKFPIQLGDYRLRKLIGQGGMSRVYLADAPDGSEVAVKLVTSSSASQAEERLAILREIRTLSLLYHPSILRVLDAGYVRGVDADRAGQVLPRGVPYMVSEYLAGAEFEAYMGRVEWPTLQSLLLSLLDALGHAHGLDVVHRDLKPSNVIVTRTHGLERVKLADFGISREMTTEVGNSLKLSGTPLFMAPEQAGGKWRDEGPWTDIYSLAVLAWKAACGSPPFLGADFMSVLTAHMRDEPPDFEPVIAVPRDFERWLRKSLAKAPRDRFQTAASAALALAEISADEPMHSGVVSTDVRSQKAVPSDLAETVLELQRDAITFHMLGEERRAEEDSDWPEPSLPGDWRRARESEYKGGAIASGLGVVSQRSVPVVDREAERDELWKALIRCRVEREPRGVLLEGPAGVGKSKLTEWLLRRVRELGACDTLVFRGVRGKTASDAISAALKHQFRTTRLDESKAFARIHAAFERVGLDGRVSAYDAVALAEMVTDRPDPERSSAALTTRAVVSPIARYLSALAKERQVVCVCEDTHVAAGLVRVFAALKRRTVGSVLFVATSRSDESGEQPPSRQLLEDAGFALMKVGPLAEADTLELVQRILGLQPDLARTVSRGSRGIPGDALEVIGYWAEREWLDSTADGFVLRAGESLPYANVPEGWDGRVIRVAERVSVPVDQLVPWLEAAAVLGPTFSVTAWREVVDLGEADVAAILDEFVRTGVVQAVGDRGWAFVRSGMREHLLESARGGGRLTALHEACLQRIASEEDDFDGGFQRGVHLRALGRFEDAFDAFEEVQRFALTSIDVDRSRACVEAMRELFRALDPAIRGAFRARIDLARVRERVGRDRFEDAAALAQQVTTRADDGGWPEIAATAEVLRGDALRMLGKTARAEEVHEHALTRCQTSGFESLEARCHVGLAAVFARTGRTDDVRRHALAGLKLHRKNEDEHGVCDALFWYSVGWQLDARLDEARDELMEAIEIARRNGFRFFLARLLNSKAELARLEDDTEETRRCLEEAAALHRSVGNERDAVVPEMNVALVDIGRHAFEEAHQVLLQARADAEAAGDVAMALFESLFVVTTGRTGRYGVFDAATARCASATSKAGVYIPEFAAQIESTGRHLQSVGEVERARRAFELAHTFFYNLGDPAGQDRVREKLDELHAIGD